MILIIFIKSNLFDLLILSQNIHTIDFLCLFRLKKEQMFPARYKEIKKNSFITFSFYN